MLALSWGTPSEYPADSAERRAYLENMQCFHFCKLEACPLKTKEIQHECSISCLTVPLLPRASVFTEKQLQVGGAFMKWEVAHFWCRVQLTLNVAVSSEFQLASNESRACLRVGKELLPE